ncbi:MAG: hypothetical protein HYX53_00175 [Chloroflexi bacterium]|nr:hypothetical protein [Chloroflexota bacterium]
MSRRSVASVASASLVLALTVLGATSFAQSSLPKRAYLPLVAADSTTGGATATTTPTPEDSDTTEPLPTRTSAPGTARGN